ncbi:response regulator transcription factor [uncultured Chryseobacterium sp.]|uniref:helix-turn-helix domain-containing protein n=1 Tax=uncultured Chryseobacterium sp. TaxID=259322 RepID=UPI0025864320|nr:response regulator transcription factor [uncultured Chryseobacterium sp.]
MILIKRVLIVPIFLIGLKIFSRSTTNQRAPTEIDYLIKKEQMDFVHFSNKNRRLNNPFQNPLHYDLLIKLDSASTLYKKEEYLNAEKAFLSILNKVENNKYKLTPAAYENLQHIGISKLFYIEKKLGNVSKGLKYIETFSRGTSPLQKKRLRLFFAVAHIELGNYKRAVQILNLRLHDLRLDTKNTLYDGIFKPEEIAMTYNTKGDAFMEWFKDTNTNIYLDSAKINYEKAYKVPKNPSDYSQYSKAIFIDHLANIALLKKQYRYSLSLFNACEKDSTVMKEDLSSETIWLRKAEIYTFLNKTDSAFFFIDKLKRKIGKREYSYDNKLKMYHLLSINYEYIGDHKNAYKFAKLSLSEIKRKNRWDISGNIFLAIHEQKEIKALSEELIKKNKRNSFLLIALFLMVFSIIIIFIRYKRSKTNKILSESLAGISKINDSNVYSMISQKDENHLIIEDEIVSRVLKKISLMELNKKFLSNDFKLSHIAKQVNTNTTYLSQIINQHKGMTFSEYVNDLRINYILKELNENPKLRKYTIKTISEEVGYKSPSTFINAFKNRTQMNPSDYIQLLEKKYDL